MYIFQWNKDHSKSLCGSKVMDKEVSKGHFSVSISKRFKHFWVVITSKLLFSLIILFYQSNLCVLGTERSIKQSQIQNFKQGECSSHEFFLCLIGFIWALDFVSLFVLFELFDVHDSFNIC